MITGNEELRGAVSASGSVSGKASTTIYYTDAYNIAVAHGFRGTVEEWLESLNGEPGAVQTVNGFAPDENGNVEIEIPEGGGTVTDEQIAEAVDKYLEENPVAGTPGKDGEKGDKGDPGEPGKDGEDGKDGQDGAPGKDGTSPVVAVSAITGGHRITITDANGTKTVDVLDGADGKNGTDGKDGKDGADGQPGANGQDGKPGEDGKDGVSATHSWNGTVLTITSASGTSSADLKGAKGDQGEKGADGAKGDKGDQGIQGIQGEKGDKGDPGEKGEQGIQGEPGQKGDKGDKGDTGSQGIPGEKGDKGDTGATGANGKDGTSVTVKSVSESTADGGSNVVTFSDGNTLNVKNGSKGNKGDPGATPQKGIDFWTPADQEAIVQDVIVALGTPVFGRVDADKKITLSTEHLADGTYRLGYEDDEGNWVELCTLEKGASYTNMLPLSINTDGTRYNGGQGWKADTRLNSSGAETAKTGMQVTGFIPAKYGDILRMRDIKFSYLPENSEYRDQYYLAFYNSSFAFLGYRKPTNDSKDTGAMDISIDDVSTDVGLASYTGTNAKDVAYIRISASGMSNDSIITINQEITD